MKYLLAVISGKGWKFLPLSINNRGAITNFEKELAFTSIQHFGYHIGAIFSRGLVMKRITSENYQPPQDSSRLSMVDLWTNAGIVGGAFGRLARVYLDHACASATRRIEDCTGPINPERVSTAANSTARTGVSVVGAVIGFFTGLFRSQS